MRLCVKTILLQGNEPTFSPVARIQVLGLYQAMTVTLAADQEKFIAEQVSSGHFKSAADVIAQSLGMTRAQEEFIRSNVAELRDKFASGVEHERVSPEF